MFEALKPDMRSESREAIHVNFASGNVRTERHTCRACCSSEADCLALCFASILNNRQVVFPVPLRPRIKLAVLKCLTISNSSGERSNGNSSVAFSSMIDLKNGSVRL
jgi:hypothetical protein